MLKTVREREIFKVENKMNKNKEVLLAEAVKKWWEKHKDDTTGPFNEYNVYFSEPNCVEIAKEIIGNWEEGEGFTAQCIKK